MIPLYDDRPTRSFPYVTIALIIANFVVFGWWQRSMGLPHSMDLAALIPADVMQRVPNADWHVLTSMFMHGTWLHLIGNMWFLWIFGTNIEDECGHFRFTIFYILCGAIAAGAHILVNPASTIPLVGASGAVSGILGAYLLKHPHARIKTLLPVYIIWAVDIPAFVFLLIWVGLHIFAQSTLPIGDKGGIAYLAHIAGFTAGLILINLFRRKREPRLATEGSWKRTKSDERTYG